MFKLRASVKAYFLWSLTFLKMENSLNMLLNTSLFKTSTMKQIIDIR